MLQQVHEEFDGKGASFVGVNVRDQAATAASFEQNYGITYPSIIDVNRSDVDAFADFVLGSSGVMRPRGPRLRGDDGLGAPIA